MCPSPLSLRFYCRHAVICPFPSLTNEAKQPGHDVSADLVQGHCCGPLIMQRKTGESLCLSNRRHSLLFFALPLYRLLEVFVCAVGLMTEQDNAMNRGSLRDTVENQCAQMLRRDIKKCLNEAGFGYFCPLEMIISLCPSSEWCQM